MYFAHHPSRVICSFGIYLWRANERLTYIGQSYLNSRGARNIPRRGAQVSFECAQNIYIGEYTKVKEHFSGQAGRAKLPRERDTCSHTIRRILHPKSFHLRSSLLFNKTAGPIILSKHTPERYEKYIATFRRRYTLFARDSQCFLIHIYIVVLYNRIWNCCPASKINSG